MRRLALVALLLLAAKPAPEGSFSLQVSGYQVTVTLSGMQHVTRNDEVTLGTWCSDAEGVGIAFGNRANQFIWEENWFGGYEPRTFTVPSNAVVCTSELIAADWFKGVPQQAWVLDGPDTYPVGGDALSQTT